MSRSKLQRTACVLLMAFVLALPAAAQTHEEVRATLMERLLSALWERLVTSLASLQADAASDPSGVPADSNGSTTSDDDSDGRIHIDPNG